jgi:hypothetical protein
MAFKIIESRDYDKFRYIGANRELNEKHVLALMDSIRKKNMLSICPCLVSGENEIIDGQHRIEAARRLEVAFYYIIADELTHEDIIALNNVKLGWNNMDYINFYTVKKVPGFQALTKKMVEYPDLKLPMVLLVISSTGINGIPQIRQGIIDVGNVKRFVEFINAWNDYKSFTVHHPNKFFLLAIRRCYMREVRHCDYDHGRIMELLARNPDIFDTTLRARFGPDLIGEWKIEQTIKDLLLIKENAA